MSGVFSIVGGVVLVGISGAQVFITRKIGAEGKSCEKVCQKKEVFLSDRALIYHSPWSK
ncbi:hypothetical protein BH18THE2_BH18THE2_38510 [soil metagenome]